MLNIKDLFGRNMEYIDILQNIENNLIDQSFAFIDNNFLIEAISHSGKEDFQIAIQTFNAVYFREILYRSYICAVSAILRQRRWISGVVLAIENSNYISFASNFRGFIESASDIYDGLGAVPKTLAELVILLHNNNLPHKKPNFIVSKELEDTLIHFMYASKNGNNAINTAKSPAQYLNSLKKSGASKIKDCYYELCEITHPASNSVMCFCEEKGPNYSINPFKDDTLIENFCKKYQCDFESIFMLSINSTLLILNLLNELDFEDIKIPIISTYNFDKIKLWNDINTILSPLSV